MHEVLGGSKGELFLFLAHLDLDALSISIMLLKNFRRVPTIYIWHPTYKDFVTISIYF